MDLTEGKLVLHRAFCARKDADLLPVVPLVIAICQLSHDTVCRVFAVCVRCPCAHVQGWTAFLLAVRYSKDTPLWEEVVEILLKKTTDINQKNTDGMKSEHFLFSSQYVSR